MLVILSVSTIKNRITEGQNARYIESTSGSGKRRGFVIKGLKEGGRDEKAERVKIDGNGETGQQQQQQQQRSRSKCCRTRKLPLSLPLSLSPSLSYSLSLSLPIPLSLLIRSPIE